MSRVRRSLTWIANATLFIKKICTFVIFVIFAFTLYELLLDNIFTENHVIFSLLLLWLLTAYSVLPHIHRRLTKLYLPDYFIGRVRTGDGLLGDPVNIAGTGTLNKLSKTLERAGWTKAEPLTFRSSIKMLQTSILKKSYPNAPVSSLYLFGKQQDLAFQIEVNGNPHARHHVRFWSTPAHWRLPGGRHVDWVGAATYDRRVGFSALTGQFTHKISEDTDEERNFVGQTIRQTDKRAKVVTLDYFMTAYRDRNGGGDSIRTDGGLLLIDLQ